MELVPCSFARNPKPRRENPELPAAAAWKTTTLDDLCDSLLIEILSRLSLKQSKRCLAVSQRWYALMSDPFFISLFDEKHKNFAFLLNYVDEFVEQKAVEKLLVISKEPDEFKSEGFSLSFLPCCQSRLRESAIVEASCNDLLLCSDLRQRNVYYVCNPFTMSWVQLPPTPPCQGSGGGVGFICDYSYYSDAAGGSTSSSAACRCTVLRVIRLRHDGSSEFKIKVQIYSSDVGKWKENVVSCGRRPYDSPPHRTNAIHYNGLLFFLSHGHGLMGLDPYDGGQLRHFIPVPEEFFHYYVRCFGVCRGTMRLFQIAECPVPFIRIWDLKDYEKGEWIMEKQVCFRDLMKSENCGWVIESANTPSFRSLVIACDPNDGDVVYFVANQGIAAFKIVSCNLQMGTLEEVCDIAWKMYCIMEVITYKPSWCTTLIAKLH